MTQVNTLFPCQTSHNLFVQRVLYTTRLRTALVWRQHCTIRAKPSDSLKRATFISLKFYNQRGNFVIGKSLLREYTNR
ncbi:hypothetical protein JW998_01595 [candidate division KSB1 bacterium]|nr:hypothetical protein [candidate division KSB1 bacterium]